MTEISEAAIVRRATELAKRDGNDWQIEYKDRPPPGTPINLKPVLDEAGRRAYLARAREELMREARNA